MHQKLDFLRQEDNWGSDISEKEGQERNLRVLQVAHSQFDVIAHTLRDLFPNVFPSINLMIPALFNFSCQVKVNVFYVAKFF